jgi:hypothetical protein
MIVPLFGRSVCPGFGSVGQQLQLSSGATLLAMTMGDSLSFGCQQSAICNATVTHALIS